MPAKPKNLVKIRIGDIEVIGLKRTYENLYKHRAKVTIKRGEREYTTTTDLAYLQIYLPKNMRDADVYILIPLKQEQYEKLLKDGIVTEIQEAQE